MENNKFDETLQSITTHFESLLKEMEKVIVGQKDLIKDLFICLLCNGHALIEGVPGLGKTLVVKTMSDVLSLDFSRIQFTPDLMPADILGTNIVNEDQHGKRFFEFFKGPIFGQIILADEINRATPKTQSALLEAMQEHSVTVFGKQYLLEEPFIVLATQNPLEMEGTYPLPEAQVDRFFYKIQLDYPNAEHLSEIIDKTTQGELPVVNKVLEGEQIKKMKKMIKEVPLATHIKEYTIRLVLSTHPENELSNEETKQFVRYGASPRGLQNIILAAKALALLQGRYNVAFEDINTVAKPVLRHRILLNLRGESEGVNPDNIIENIINRISKENV